MKNDNPEDRDENLRLLKAAREEFESLRVGMQATVNRLQADEVDAAPTTQITNFQKSVQSVINIEADLAKRSYERRSGGEGACPLDLEAARREVIERLIALSEARGSGGIT